MSVSLAIHRCGMCGGCRYWYVERPRREGEIFLGVVGLTIPAGATSGRLIGLKRKPRGLSLEVRRDGTVEAIAEDPCEGWRRFIRKHYKAGIRFIRFEFSSNSGEKS